MDTRVSKCGSMSRFGGCFSFHINVLGRSGSTNSKSEVADGRSELATFARTLTSPVTPPRPIVYIKPQVPVKPKGEYVNTRVCKDAENILLHTAVIEGDIERVKELINMGVDINFPDERGNTPLHRAVIRGRHAIIDVLLENKPNCDIPNINGNTPLDLAKFSGDQYFVKKMDAINAVILESRSRGFSIFRINMKAVKEDHVGGRSSSVSF